MITILLIGYYGFSNAGDEAILASLVQQFRSRIPRVRLIVCSGNPEDTRSQHQVEAISWNRLSEIENAIRASDLVGIGGGGLFHDHWGTDPDTLLTDRHWGIAYYAGCAFLTFLNKKPLVLLGVGVGPLISEYGIRLTRATCEASSLIAVRDSGSRDLLLNIGVSPEKLYVTADPAFAFRPQTAFTVNECVPVGFDLRAPVLGVSIRNWSIGVNPAFLEREIAAALDLYIDRTAGSIVFFPFQQIEGEHEDDRAIAERVLAKLRFRNKAVLTNGRLTPEQIYGAFRGCQVFLGMRLHALIFAETLGIPSVALSYDPKIDALNHPFRLDVRAVDAEVLSRTLIQALSAESPQASTESQRQRALETCTLALEVLDHPVALPQPSSDALDLLRRGISSQIQASSGARTDQADFEARILAFDRENDNLRTLLHDSERHLAARVHELNEAAELHKSVLAEIDRFRANFETELNAQRSQKAWQVMLLIRKAYTLLFRGSKPAFVRWAASASIGRWGSLQEFEPRFPDITQYIPETFRLSVPISGTHHVPQSSRNPPQRDKYDVLILAIIDFDFRYQRPQQIAAELARRGHRVFWISPSRFIAPSSPDAFQAIPLRENLWEIHMRSRNADIYMGELQTDHVAAMSASLNGLRDEWNINENIVIAQLPFWRRLALQLRKSLSSKLFYDCMDDWETFQNMGAFNVSEEKEFVLECDVLVVTGAELEQKYLAQHLAPVLIRNGADFAFFTESKPADLLPNVPHPIVGYFGAIADWIDLDLVLSSAQLRPHYSFVLIGQVFNRDTTSLEALPNVFLLGSKRYEDIPAYLRHFDACLIPFLLNQVTKATDPVKLYEYFSLGKPVIATDMAELKQCGDIIYIGRGAEDFSGKIDAALNERDSTLHDQRIAFAQANTWSSRVDQIDSAAHALFPLVSILIVTYNSEEFIAPCLDSVVRNTAYPNYEIIVVDNASTDSTTLFLAGYGNIRLIRLSENTGFAAGNNRAAAEAKGDYLVFLNTDTMVTSGWLHNLLIPLQQDAEIGQICPVTNFAGNEAKINITYRNANEMEDFAAALTREHRGKTRDIRVAPLFCSLVSRKVWDRVGELDVSFGMGMFEDDDFSMRIRAAGLRVVTAENCFVHHFGQGSFAKIPTDAYNQLFEKNKKTIEAKWNTAWQPHRTRPGVRAPFEEERFRPAKFLSGLEP